MIVSTFQKIIIKHQFVERRAISLMFSSWFDIPRQQLQAKHHFCEWEILVFICWLALLHTKVNWMASQAYLVMMNSCNRLYSSPHSTSFWQSSTQTKLLATWVSLSNTANPGLSVSEIASQKAREKHKPWAETEYM